MFDSQYSCFLLFKQCSSTNIIFPSLSTYFLFFFSGCDSSEPTMEKCTVHSIAPGAQLQNEAREAGECNVCRIRSGRRKTINL